VSRRSTRRAGRSSSKRNASVGRRCHSGVSCGSTSIIVSSSSAAPRSIIGHKQQQAAAAAAAGTTQASNSMPAWRRRILRGQFFFCVFFTVGVAVLEALEARRALRLPPCSPSACDDLAAAAHQTASIYGRAHPLKLLSNSCLSLGYIGKNFSVAPAPFLLEACQLQILQSARCPSLNLWAILMPDGSKCR
jgi:hypothetical protein